MIYADTSALIKLVIAEAESAALASWLRAQDMPVVSSSLCRVEVAQSCHRLTQQGPDNVRTATLTTADRVLHGVDMIPLAENVVDVAAGLTLPGLRSLDALHLASALTIEQDLRALLAYDMRLLAAAQALQLPVISPGRP